MLARNSVEILVIAAMVYVVLRFLQGTRGLGVLKGLIMVIGVVFIILIYLAEKFELATLEFLTRNILTGSLFVLVVVFQPELRRGLMRLGQNPAFRLFSAAEDRMTAEIVQCASALARKHIGALIAIQRDVGIGPFIDTAVKLDSEVSSDLLTTIFWPGSPLHDGAVIIRGQRIAAAGCLFPLTENPQLAKRFGTRHRAAIGLTEESDAVCVVVSEETGNISVCEAGRIIEGLSPEELKKTLNNLLSLHASLRPPEDKGEGNL